MGLSRANVVVSVTTPATITQHDQDTVYLLHFVNAMRQASGPHVLCDVSELQSYASHACALLQVPRSFTHMLARSHGGGDSFRCDVYMLADVLAKDRTLAEAATARRWHAESLCLWRSLAFWRQWLGSSSPSMLQLPVVHLHPTAACLRAIGPAVLVPVLGSRPGHQAMLATPQASST